MRRPSGTSGLGRSTGRSRRRYQRLWARWRRQDPKFRRREAERNREYRARPAAARAQRERRARWYETHRQEVRRYNHDYHERVRAHRCFFCRKKGRSGRGGTRMVERMVIERGQLVSRQVRWCGRC